MKCQYCSAEIPDIAAFCPECGKQQEKSKTEHTFCPNCGSRLESESIFCPECGSRVAIQTMPDSEPPKEALPPVQNPARPGGKGHIVVLVFVLIAVAIAALIALAVRALFFGGRSDEPDITDASQIQNYLEGSEEAANPENDEEADLSDVDYNLLENNQLSMEGMIKTAKNGGKVLQWKESLTFYGTNESGERVLMKDTKNAYVDDTVLPDGFLDTVSANKQVTLDGVLYFRGNNLYISPLYVYDSSGKDLIAEHLNSRNESSSENSNSDYILPQSNSRLLNGSDISGLSLQEINYAKNEVYARHGRRFKSAELQNYFNSKSWYNGTIEPDSFNEGMLSDIEKKNVEYLKEIEFGMAPGGYQLDTQ